MNVVVLVEEFRAELFRMLQRHKMVGEIGQIFELITLVADEIDLLALNATLEAAQAREAGKRFGAVAGEIQRLQAGQGRPVGKCRRLFLTCRRQFHFAPN